ncbi:unnamed protein product [Notodromas monacha]|uniref:RRM domain-containing protein n=1 Tax=Notodromas monacha TaxID=399045 RepID=A0A7R9BTU3_9CRUS|nr:unnamed protein product [Notodromas monacha]CAG0921621.1 unnamed protein product [Notodromas monacha]
MSRHRDSDVQCKVYVGNLTRNASEHEIEDAFSKYGPLRNVWVARNPPGFAFVEFEDPRDADDAVRALDNSRLCGTRVRVEFSSGKSRRGGRFGGRGGRDGGRDGGRERDRDQDFRPRGSPVYGRYKRSSAKMNTSMNEGGFSRDFDGPDKSGGGRTQNLVHMHIMDYLSQGDDITVGGRPVDMMVFVGKITQIDPGTGMVDYEIEDRTGKMMLKSLVDPKDEVTPVNLFSYVRVVCSPKNMTDKKAALVLKMFPLPTDQKELKLHSLMVQYDKLRILESDQRTAEPTGGMNGATDYSGDSMDIMHDKSPKGQVFRVLFEAAKRNPEVGADLKDIAVTLKGKFSLAEIRNIVMNQLMVEGHVYGTFDDDHYSIP